MKKYFIALVITLISIFSFNNEIKAYDEDIIKKCADWANGKLSDLLGSDINNAVVLYNHDDNTYYVPIKQIIYNASVFKNEGWHASYYSNHFVLVSPNWYLLYLYKYNTSSDSFTKVTATDWYTGNSSSIILDSSGYDFEVVYADRNIIFNDVVPSGTYKGITYYTGDIFYDVMVDKTSFDEIISTSQYSKVEFEFDLPTINYCEDDINCILSTLNYDIKNVTKDGLENTISFGIPYLEKKYLYDTGSSNITKTDTIPLADATNYSYNGTYDILFDETMTKLKLVVPLDYIDYSYVHVKFDSDLEYTVTYTEKEQADYIGSVDITGKAGVMFIPTQIDDDMLIGFDFAESATYSLQLRDTYKTNYKVLNYYSIGYCDDRDYSNVNTNICNNGSNGYQVYLNFKKNELEQSVFVVNRDYYEYQDKEKKAIVYYDTRYFQAVIYDEMTSTPSFNHPITDEEVTLGDLTDYDEYYTNEVHTSFFEMFSNAFSEFKNDILKLFSYINTFWNGLSSTLQNFYIVIFSLVLFIFLIRFIL